nr:uncharacterized protein LOC112696649 [Arachis hypogaea]
MALVNWEWMSMYQNASLSLMSAVSSDHCPLILDVIPVHRVRKYFKFEAYWADHKDCSNVVKRGWCKEEQNGDEWDKISRNINNCKGELKKWSKVIFKRADREIQKMKDELKKLHNSDFTEENQRRMQLLKENIATLWKQEEKFWEQRSRLKWLRWRNKNTAFFHATTIHRRQRNRIERPKNASGQWLNNTSEIMEHIEEHFQKLFASATRHGFEGTINKISRVTKEINNELLMDIMDEEVRKAVFSMGSLKALGPDGLNGIFYQKHWEVISKDVCAVVRAFFNSGHIPEEINETTVVLIPKTKNPESLNELRPISCCNFIYKIISRIIVLRLKKWMEAIVSPTQSTFVGGRLIQDNVVIVQEVYHSLNRKGKGGSNSLAIKLDMNKAYDRLE